MPIVGDGCHLALHDFRPDVETLQLLLKGQRQQVAESFAVIGQLLFKGHRNALRSFGRQRIHTGAEDIALRDLRQSGINTTTHDLFEYLAALLLPDDHGLPHLAIHLECVARDGLSFAERKHKLPFQHAGVGIEKRHLQLRRREVTSHLDLGVNTLHLHRLQFAL